LSGGWIRRSGHDRPQPPLPAEPDRAATGHPRVADHQLAEDQAARSRHRGSDRRPTAWRLPRAHFLTRQTAYRESPQPLPCTVDGLKIEGARVERSPCSFLDPGPGLLIVVRLWVPKALEHVVVTVNAAAVLRRAGPLASHAGGHRGILPAGCHLLHHD